MANGDIHATAFGETNNLFAIFHRDRNRLFNQEMAPCIDGVFGYLEMRVTRGRDVHQVQVYGRQHMPMVGKDARAGVFGLGRAARGFRRRHNGRKLSLGICGDGLGVELAPGAKTHQAETDRRT